MNIITTFPDKTEFEKVKNKLDDLDLEHILVDPLEIYRNVGIPAIVLDHNTRTHLAESGLNFVSSGWVDCPEIIKPIPDDQPPSYSKDIFGKAVIMVLAPCVADPSKIRIIAHTDKDISLSFPFINAQMNEASFNKEWPVLSFMDGYRMISLYQNRITIAKADDIVDGWRVLEKIRRLVNDTYARRDEIEPSYEMRKKPPVLEIFKRLPGSNCRKCGEATCMAFASRVWNGDKLPSDCIPVMEGEYNYLKNAYLEICASMGTEPLN